MSEYYIKTIDPVRDVNCILKDGEELIRVPETVTAMNVVEILQKMDEELEAYKDLYVEMKYYFESEDVQSFNDLDHKDFHHLKRLSKGLID